MGCAICTQLIDMCSTSASQAGPRAMEMSSFPEVLQQDYHRLSGLHYTSSFSDAEDCCDETTSTSSSLDYFGMDDWQNIFVFIANVLKPSLSLYLT